VLSWVALLAMIAAGPQGQVHDLGFGAAALVAVLGGLLGGSRCLVAGVAVASASFLAGFVGRGWLGPRAAALVGGLVGPADGGVAAIAAQAGSLLPLIIAGAVLSLVLATRLRGRGSRARLDVVLGRGPRGPLVLSEEDRFSHMIAIGATGTGKSVAVLRPLVLQDLDKIAGGMAGGLTLVEPKGDLVEWASGYARSLGLDVAVLDPTSPTGGVFNPLEGPLDEVAEIVTTVLRMLFGPQEAFFSHVQQVLARQAITLLKLARGDSVTLMDLRDLLREPRRAEELLGLANARVQRSEIAAADRLDHIRHFFVSEMGTGARAAEDWTRHSMGLRAQLERILANATVARVLCGPSDIDLDAHLARGGVLLVNTALGKLGDIGDVFGRLVVLHFQAAVFRRPAPEGARMPHILYVDEFGRYADLSCERLLTMGRSYRVGAVLALQTTSQLMQGAHGSDERFRQITLANCRTRVCLAVDDERDAEKLSKLLGDAEVEDVSRSRSSGPKGAGSSVTTRTRREPLFGYSELMRLPRFEGVVRTVRAGVPQEPVRCHFTPVFDAGRNGAGRKRGLRVPLVEVPEVAGPARQVEIDLTPPAARPFFQAPPGTPAPAGEPEPAQGLFGFGGEPSQGDKRARSTPRGRGRRT